MKATTQIRYKCITCGGTFVSERSNEEALEEARKNFGSDVSADDCGLVCEDCYTKFKQWFDKLPDAERAAIAQNGIQ